MKKNYFRYLNRVGIGIACNVDIKDWAKKNNCLIINSTRYSLDEITASYEEENKVQNAKIFELIKSGQLVSLIDETIDSFENFSQILILIEFNFLLRSLVRNKTRKIVFLFCNKKGDDFIVKFSWKEGHFFLRIEKFPDLLEIMAFPEGNVYNHKNNIFFVVPE